MGKYDAIVFAVIASCVIIGAIVVAEQVGGAVKRDKDSKKGWER